MSTRAGRVIRRFATAPKLLAALAVLGVLGLLAGTAVFALGSGGSGSRSRGVSSVEAGRASHSAKSEFSAYRKALLTSSEPDNLPSDCLPNSAGPPTSPYELGLVGTIHGGSLTAGPASVSDIDASFCGIATVVPGGGLCPAATQVTSQSDDQTFGPLKIDLTLVPGMTPSVGFQASGGTIVGSTPCGSSKNGLSVTLDATVGGTTTSLFGVECTIGPITIPLSGVVTGPFTDMTGTLTSGSFGVPAIQPSSSCPGQVPAAVNQIAGLPLAPGQSSASLPVTTQLYQPEQG